MSVRYHRMTGTTQMSILILVLMLGDSTWATTCKKGPGRGFDNPCCAFPCQNGGVCVSQNKDYTCDCTGLQYFGRNCHRATWARWFLNLIKLSTESQNSFFGSFPLFWSIVNLIPNLHYLAMEYIYKCCTTLVPSPPAYNTGHDYITMDSYFNRSYYAMELPPVPDNCPTAMGVKGPELLPRAKDVFEKIFLRKKFKPSKIGTNLLFVAFAQHFVFQFFKTDHNRGPGMTWGQQGVDASQIYGQDENTKQALRCRQGGKLKTQQLNGEQYPPFLEDVPGVNMWYPEQKEGMDMEALFSSDDREGGKAVPKWGMGHPIFSSNPWVFVVATIWIREHNRVCEVLQLENPFWDDEQLYQTAQLIVIGEMIQITMKDYLQYVSQYHLSLSFEPHVTQYSQVQYSNRVRQEFNMAYQWHPMIPDKIVLGSEALSLEELYYSDNKVVTDKGLDVVLDAMTNTVAGEMTYHNHPPSLEFVCKQSLQWSRAARLQSFNNYRKAFGFSPYKSFMELTGDREIAKRLEELYGHVDAVEFLVGLIVEKKTRAVVGPSMVVMSGAWTIKAMMSSALASPGWWKPSTFGGKTGMNIIKAASLKNLICNNIKSDCSKINLSFKVPDYVLEDEFVETDAPKEEVKQAIERKCGMRPKKMDKKL